MSSGPAAGSGPAISPYGAAERAALSARLAATAKTAPFALAALSGLIYAASFPPLSWSWAAWIALVPLLAASSRLSPLGAALAGMCWTATAAAGFASFLPSMLSRYFGLPTLPSALASIAFTAVLLGIPVSAYAAWVAWLVRRRAANPVLLAGGWIACELARAHGVIDCPWALAAYSQLGWSALIQLADLFGPYGIGLLVAGVNACVAAWLVADLRGRHPLLATTAVLTALAGTLLYGQWRLGHSFDDGEAVRVTVVQGGAPPAKKSERAARLQRYVALSEGAAADLIVWPEYAVEAYLEEPTRTRETVLRVARETRSDLILGGPHYATSPSGTRYHNSIYLIRDGRLGPRYDKHLLVPFAEEARIEWLLGRPATSYTPGTGGLVLPGSALRIGAFLCLESMYPGPAREASRQGADVLVNLSNDAWFGDAAPARHQLAIAALRAVENRRYLIRATSTGFSAVVDPHGRIAAETSFDTFETIHSTVHASRAHTPYQRWGDAFAWIAIACVAAASLRLLPLRTIVQPNRR